MHAGLQLPPHPPGLLRHRPAEERLLRPLGLLVARQAVVMLEELVEVAGGDQTAKSL